MPFVLRTVEPKFVSRTSLHDENGLPKVKDEELLAVTNCTLSNALRQLASLMILANDIFSELTNQLNEIGERSKTLQLKITLVDEKVQQYDPKKVTVPEGDLTTFALRKIHFNSKPTISTTIFTEDTRPRCLRELYTKAGVLDGQGGRSSRGGRRSPMVQCTPILGGRRRKLREKVDVDIETRLPAAIEELRKWTSSEALGDPTVAPDGLPRVTGNLTMADGEMSAVVSSDDEEPLDHKLPSPEEQFTAIASKFPPEVVTIDTSGRRFDRMCNSRRSLLHVDTSCDRTQNGDSQTVKRRTRSRKPRGKRRNTITGTDQKEIRDAIAGDTTSPVDESGSPDAGAVIRSHSSDLLKKSPYDIQFKKSHFNTLKEWGRSRLRLISRSPSDSGRDTSRTEKSKTNKSPTVQDIDDVNIYETVTMRRKRNSTKQQDRKISHERNNSYSSSERSVSLPVTAPMSGAMSLAVKLREANIAGRRRRTAITAGRDEPHSSSGNWSASSESGRTSIGSEITSTTAAPRSSTSAATSINSLNVLHGPPSSIVSRRRFLNTSGSGSVTSEGTLTPDIIHDLHDDMETSSEFSCDTEGYYTSFHMDSGLKTLKEEDISLPITPLHTTNTFSNSSGNQTAENEYELFGKGSTSTTTSSAGTVCTTMLAAISDRSLVTGPTVPERKSSLSKLNKSRSSSNSSNVNLDKSINSNSSNENTNTIKRSSLPKKNKQLNTDEHNTSKDNDTPKETTVVADVHQIKVANTGAESPDSGHNTSSSPVDDSLSSAHGGKISCGGSELDYSESSDLEGIDRIERIRVKTTINSSRIPSMCVITPTNSDDESSNSSKQDASDRSKDTEKAINSKKSPNTSGEIDEEEKLKKRISSRPKLDLPPQETDLDTLVFNDEPVSAPSPVHNSDEDCETNEPKQSIISNILSKKNKNKKLTQTKTADSQKSASRSTFMPLNNLMCKLKDALPQKLKKSVIKDLPPAEPIYGDNGEYVTIADVKNNNQKINVNSGVYYTNDVVKRNLQTVLSGKLQETEYVSLNELPSNISTEGTEISASPNNSNNKDRSSELVMRHGARVTLDSNGKVIYSSDSLKRRKGAHTTFEPGPFVKDVTDGSPMTKDVENIPSPTANVDVLMNTSNIRSSPVTIVGVQEKPGYSSRPLSPQLGKVVIRAPNIGNNNVVPTSEIVRMPPSNIVTPNTVIRPMSPRMMSRGAYVNIQDAEGISLSPTKDNDPDYRHSSADRASPGHPVYLPPQVNMHSKNYIDTARPVSYGPTQKLYSQDDMTAYKATTGLYSQLPVRKQGNTYWTLQPKRPQTQIAPDANTFHRSVTPDITRGLYSYPTINNSLQTQFHQAATNTGPQNTMNIPSEPSYVDIDHYRQPNPVHYSTIPARQNFAQSQNVALNNSPQFINIYNNLSSGRFSSIGRDADSFTMSPIDPRNAGKFQSSTPTRNQTETDNMPLADKIVSPVKSTMSNEELYAVIHKSKKKMNIKSPPLDRAGSPALSVTSLSPGSSESSITGRITPVKLPETGYLNDARMRHSWSPNLQDNNAITSELNRPPACGSPRPDMGPKQSWSCADRLGPAAQTSRLDFKKLLLQHGVRLNLQPNNKPAAKPSAVERLKLSKESNTATTVNQGDQSNINILDLSGSPKTYANRRIMRITNNPAPCSPSRTNVLIKEHKATPKILLSPKTQWRFSSPRSDVLSSPIPEAFNEDESPNSSIEKDHKQIISEFSRKATDNNKMLYKNTDIKPAFRRNLIPTIKENIATDSTEPDNSVVPLSSISPLKHNIFLATQENNFTKQEQQALNTFGQPQNRLSLQDKMTRAEMLQAQKAQFLSQDFSNVKSSLVPTQFKIPNKIVENPTQRRDKEKSPSPPALETAL